MKKIKLLLVLFTLVSVTVSAQSFFKSIPKLKKQAGQQLIAAVPTGDITFWALRPIVSAATLFVGGTVEAAAGGGFSYQNITQSPDGKNYVNYAISAEVLAGGSVVPNKPTDIEKFGLMVSALNNTIGAGPCTSRIEDPVTHKKTWKFGLMAVWSFNFNNGPK